MLNNFFAWRPSTGEMTSQYEPYVPPGTLMGEDIALHKPLSGKGVDVYCETCGMLLGTVPEELMIPALLANTVLGINVALEYHMESQHQ